MESFVDAMQKEKLRKQRQKLFRFCESRAK